MLQKRALLSKKKANPKQKPRLFGEVFLAKKSLPEGVGSNEGIHNFIGIKAQRGGS